MQGRKERSLQMWAENEGQLRELLPFFRDAGALRHEWPGEIVDLGSYRNGPAGENIKTIRRYVREVL